MILIAWKNITIFPPKGNDNKTDNNKWDHLHITIKHNINAKKLQQLLNISKKMKKLSAKTWLHNFDLSYSTTNSIITWMNEKSCSE